MSPRLPALLAAVLLFGATATGCSTEGDTRAANSAPEPTRPAPTVSTAVPEFVPPAGTAPGQRFAIGVRQLDLNRGGDRPLAVTIWYPARGRASAAPKRQVGVADGRFPVVLFSHGLTGRPDDYLPLLAEWVAAGFVVAAPAYPHTSAGVADYRMHDVVNQPADASYVLDAVLRLDTRAGDPLRGRLATDRVAAAGHSAGGITTLGLFTSGRDERLSAGIVLAGTSLGVGTSFTGRAAPLLFVHGQLDEVVSYESGRAAYDVVPWPKAMLTLPKGDHGRGLLNSGDGSLKVVGTTTVEFLRWALYGDPGAKRRLTDSATGGDLASLDNRL